MSAHWHLQNLRFINCVLLGKQWKVIPKLLASLFDYLFNALVDCSDVLAVFRTALPNLNSASV